MFSGISVSRFDEIMYTGYPFFCFHVPDIIHTSYLYNQGSTSVPLQNQTWFCLFMISLLLDPERHLEQQLHRYQKMVQFCFVFCKSFSNRFVARSSLLSSRESKFRALNKFSDCSPLGCSFGACRQFD